MLDKLRKEVMSSGHYSSSAELNKALKLVDDLENDAIKLFKKKAKESGRLDDAALDVTNETLIQNLHITEGNYLTRACMLAFHPDPEKWVTGAYIKVAYFENDADILYQDEIHGPLILQVEKTMDLIYSKYRL